MFTTMECNNNNTRKTVWRKQTFVTAEDYLTHGSSNSRKILPLTQSKGEEKLLPNQLEIGNSSRELAKKKSNNKKKMNTKKNVKKGSNTINNNTKKNQVAVKKGSNNMKKKQATKKASTKKNSMKKGASNGKKDNNKKDKDKKDKDKGKKDKKNKKDKKVKKVSRVHVALSLARLHQAKHYLTKTNKYIEKQERWKK